MAFTRRNRYLECFYCGRKSSTRYDGQRSFECLHCDATNYLDENGDITDPPASAIRESTPAKVTYAVSRTVSPPSKSSGSIFCETCLNNQRLFTASIAQYLPDDPDAPDYAEREQQYYDFRKRLEKIYPQICAECEPKVRRRLEQSAYTAKTDVLRRMIDQSKTNKMITKRSWLDVFHSVGRWLWVAGFVLEVMSHVLGLSLAGLEYCASRGSASWSCSLLQSFAVPLLRMLPEQGRLLRWSFYAGLSSCWWNPRFVQTVRGFTKHLIGLPNWYIYQLMVVGIRLFSMRFFGDTESRALTTATVFGAHLLLITFALIIFRFATTCVRVDTTPLFGAKSKLKLRRSDSPQKVGTVRKSSKPEGVKNMSDLLDEILKSPSLSTKPLPRSGAPPPTVGDLGGASFAATSFARKPNLELQSLSLSEQQSPSLSPPPNFTQTDYEEEMDWSPTTSKHRAFSSYRSPSPRQQGFSQAPTEEKKGAFWYRVPPAPIPPAQRLCNPPNQPRLRNIPPTKPETFTFRGARGFGASTVTVESAADAPPPVAFARPSFFSPPPEDDPRNGLADFFEESFTLRQDREQRTARRSWMGNLFGSKK
ncbi:hypothetical protein BR93DRAFT_896859 [Coniochaeta sp. PMI_546]|nr:hypothetical protein BR93DRAFT_896859 [Coniochaeta sp. PMI_546]